MTVDARLRAHSAPVSYAAPRGLHTLDVGGSRDCYLYIPARYDPLTPTPLVLLLHGAGGQAHDGLHLLLNLADDAGLALLAPGSHAATWDILAGASYGPDRDLVDRALDRVFAGCHIDPGRIAVGGFSDGATYALALGLANGRLFTHVLAFSPGFVPPMRAEGKPAVFVSHGRADRVLPVETCGRRVAQQLREADYPVHYEEFDGGHALPPRVARLAIGWLRG